MWTAVPRPPRLWPAAGFEAADTTEEGTPVAGNLVAGNLAAGNLVAGSLAVEVEKADPGRLRDFNIIRKIQ